MQAPHFVPQLSDYLAPQPVAPPVRKPVDHDCKCLVPSVASKEGRAPPLGAGSTHSAVTPPTKFEVPYARRALSPRC